jgi:DNA-directed RNA polymerase subunit K/omega
MTYIARREVTSLIQNKFEAVRVLALECRRLNDEMRAREESTDRKITSQAVERLLDGRVKYYDARERREQERSEAMLAAAEGILEAGVGMSAVLAVEPEDTDATESIEAAEAAAEATTDAPVAPKAEADAAVAAAADAPGEEEE